MRAAEQGHLLRRVRMKITLRLTVTRGKKPKNVEQEPHPEGSNFTNSELAGESDRNHELNSHDRPSHYGRSISMKWQPK